MLLTEVQALAVSSVVTSVTNVGDNAAYQRHPRVVWILSVRLTSSFAIGDPSQKLVSAGITDVQMQLKKEWRRGWDLNPRYPLRYVRFRGGSFQPLTHLSGKAVASCQLPV